MNPERHVADQLDEHAAEAEHDERTEDGVLGHADEHFVAAADELLDQDALGVRERRSSPPGRLHAHLLALDVENDAADIGLVEGRR